MNHREILTGFGLSEEAQNQLMERVRAGLNREPDWENLVQRVHRSMDHVAQNQLSWPTSWRRPTVGGEDPEEVHLGGFLAALQVTLGIAARTAIRVGARQGYARLIVCNEKHMDEHRA